MRDPKNIQDIIPEKYKYAVDAYLRYSDVVYEFFKSYRENITNRYISGIPDISEWLKIYHRDSAIVFGIKYILLELIKNNSKALDVVFSRLKVNKDFDIDEFLYFFTFMASRFSPDDPLNDSEKKIIMEKYYKAKPREYNHSITSVITDSDIETIIKSTAVNFIVKVWLPCILFFFTDFRKLYSEAVEGNIDSLCKLILIDKAIIYDKDIAKVIENTNESSAEGYTRVMNAFNSKVYLPSNRKYKVILAMIIKKLAKSEGYSISYDDLLRYFHQKGGLFGEDAIDKDLNHYEDSESFAKEARRIFEKYLKPRKTGH